MKELWRKIPGFRHYTVSSFGRIRNPFGKVLKFNKNYKGYLVVKLYPYGGGKARTHFVHRLVAKAFISNPNNLPQVNHKDHNPANNIVSNLEWCTNTYNQRYSHALNVFQYSLDGNFIKKWDALSDIEKDLSIPTTNISKCCKGEILTINQFIFLYEGEDIVSRLEAIKNRWKCQNKKVNSYNKDMVILKTFSSINEAASYYKFSPKTVTDCCKGRKSFNKNITFRYV